MLKIRLTRIGRKNDPTFRVVVTNSQNSTKAGKHTELLGTYNPKTKQTVLDADRIVYWISQGAQVSDTMHNLLINKKIIEGKKINVLPKKSPIVTEKEGGEVAPATTETPAEITPAEASPEVPVETPTETPAETAVAEETPVQA
jgi:small subunit ribosomal protein S16